MDVEENSFSSRLMKERARSQAVPSGVSWPLGKPSAATLSFGLVVWFPAAPDKSGRDVQIARAISNGQELDCGFFTESGLVSLSERRSHSSLQWKRCSNHGEWRNLSSYLRGVCAVKMSGPWRQVETNFFHRLSLFKLSLFRVLGRQILVCSN